MDNLDAIGQLDCHRIVDLGRVSARFPEIARLPVARRVLLEFLLRSLGRDGVTEDHIYAAMRPCGMQEQVETLFLPARVLMQDYAGMAVLVDLAAMRSKLVREGRDPRTASPRIPVDLVIDHSLILHHTGPGSQARNLEREVLDNAERYRFLKWAERAVEGLRVVPPGQGIIHQLNMERFARPVVARDGWLLPDTVLGTDSHTTMVNGVGTLGWGVGGIEAMAAMMGTPLGLRMPRILGLRLTGEKPAGVQALDLALSLTEVLRARGVVDHVLEVFGPGATALSAEDRATIANMSPEYGATATFFAPDDTSLDYFARQGHSTQAVTLACRYLRRAGLWAEQCEAAAYDDRIEFDLSRCVRAAAGPTRPDQRCDLDSLGTAFSKAFPGSAPDDATLKDGDIVLAAITSCTNTANPEAMITAGLVARRAKQHGLTVRPGIKCTMALGSTSVGRYLDHLGLLKDLQALGFHIDGYGCGACVGNSGPLSVDVEAELAAGTVTAVAVLSGNRNFPGRIHPHIRANFLTSPAGVVALALAGHIRSDLATTPVGHDASGNAVMLDDLWPDEAEIRALRADIAYASRPPREQTGAWARIKAPKGPAYSWDATSSYLVEPPFIDLDSPRPDNHLLSEAVPLLVLGDAITTDHISPVGRILGASDAGRYLASIGVAAADFNTYGARRGNHEVMVRGTFANPRLQNRLTDRGGPWTRLSGGGGDVPIFEAAETCRQNRRQTVVIAGKNYGAGSARDWAAKGTRLLGIRAVIAESFERIHRANLICAGVLPLEVAPASVFPCEPDLRLSLPLRWSDLTARAGVELHVARASGPVTKVPAIIRADTAQDVAILKQGGLLPAIYGNLSHVVLMTAD